MTDIGSQIRFLNKQKFINAVKQDPNLLLTDILRLNNDIETKYPGRALEMWAEKMLNSEVSNIERVRLILKTVGKFSNIIHKPSVSANLQVKVRKIIVALFGKGSDMHQFSYIAMKLSKDDKETLVHNYNKKVSEGNRQQTIVKMSDLLKLIVASKQDDAIWQIKAAAIELSMGARIGEILMHSTFEPDPDNANNIIQNGIYKARDNQERIRSVSKPVIFLEVSEVIEIIEHIRENIGFRILTWGDRGFSESEIVNKITPQVNLRIKKIVQSSRGPLTSHDLRRIYTHVAYRLFGLNKKPHISEAAFINGVLGHDKNLLGTSISYSTFYVDFDE